MRIHFKGALAILRPFGFLQSNNMRLNDSEINMIKARRSECVLISLRDAIDFDKQWLSAMINLLQDVSARTQASVGICDYSAYKHQIILKNLGVIVTFSLFESYKEATLFFGRVSRAKLAKKVLLFNNNVQKRDLIQKRLNERGYECDICKNFREFIQKKAESEYAIGSWTTLSVARKAVEIFNRDDMIVYRISGLIDSEFKASFDFELHKSFMASGFKFFALIVDAASITNILGANFLVFLAEQSSKNGASIGICGINKSSVPAGIISMLENANILLFNSIDEFSSHNEAIYATGKSYESAQTGLTKALVERLPSIIEICIDTLSTMSNSLVCRGDVSLRTYDIYEGYLCGSLAFYGAMSFKIMLSLPPKVATRVCACFGGELEDAFVDFMHLVGQNILEHFLAMSINIKASMPKIFILQEGIDHGSLGACVNLEIDKENALLFIAR